MATYKVIQDIEAEDKLVGPLSLRQFIYAGICVLFLYLSFLVITKGVGLVAAVFLPPALLFGFLAFPWRGEQPTEVWALAKVQFWLKPRKRIWNQTGVKELVTITAPKKVERVLTNGLSQTEVRSRLRALADTIDSRGWIVKNVAPSVYNQPGFLQGNASSDRLIDIAVAPPAPAYVPQDQDDMLDMQNNPVAQKLSSMIDASQKAHREELMERMRTAGAAPTPAAPAAGVTTPASNQNNYWFLNQPQPVVANLPQDVVTFNTQVVAPGAQPANLPIGAATPTPDEEAFIKQLDAQQSAVSPNMNHLHVIQPLSAQTPPPPNQAQTATPPAAGQYSHNQPGAPNTPPPSTPAANAQQQMTPAPDAAILDLARNDDLNVATIAREAQKRKDLPDGEVVISLH